MRKHIIYQTIGLCVLLVCLGAYPAIGQPRAIDNIAATPDCAEPWRFSVTGTVTLPEQSRDRVNWWVVIYTQSGSGGNIQLVKEETPHRPRSVPLNAFSCDRARNLCNWELHNIWLGTKEFNDRQYILYICLISARTQDELLGLRETHNKFSNTNELLDEIGRRHNLPAVAAKTVVRDPSNENTCGQPKIPTSRTAWEYKHTVNSSIEELNAHGSQGWELIGCSIEANGNKNFYLKRTK